MKLCSVLVLTVVVALQNHSIASAGRTIPPTRKTSVWLEDGLQEALLLGDSCTSSAACERGLSGSVCVDSVCTCQPYHVAVNATTCLPTSLLGSECTTEAQCSVRVAGSSCVDGVCSCNQGLVPHRRHLCLPASSLGDKCFSDEQCRLGNGNSYCKFIIPKVFGRCHCVPSTQHIGKRCVKAILNLGSRCETSSECQAFVKHSACVNSTCTCNLGFTAGFSADRCVLMRKGTEDTTVPQHVTLGQPCLTWSQCQAADPNSACLNGICSCLIESSTCGNNSTGCHPHTFQCRSSGKCISRVYVCNGVRDCEDGSDEDCYRPDSSCPAGSFSCGDSSCISSQYLCDGKQHCSNGQDEKYCAVSPRQGCPGDAFRCANGRCVPGHSFCNGIIDCPDGSDEPEAACKGQLKTDKDSFCPFRCGNGLCRSAAVLCSGQDGCGDNSDETQCSICRCPSVSALFP